MMFRVVCLFLGTVILGQSAFATCDARSAWRGEHVVHYVPKVEACLEAPNEGFWFDETVEQEIFDLVNGARRAAGLNELAPRRELLPAARIHSFDMAQEEFFDHRGPDGRTTPERVAALDRTLILSQVRENIASIGGALYYEDAGALLHNLLMESDGHRANILAEDLSHMAMGVVRTDNGAWVTQVFVNQSGSLLEPLVLSISAKDGAALPEARIEGWDFRGLSFSSSEGVEFASDDALDDLRDDANLLVIGQKAVDERALQIIRMKGPLVTFVP